MTQRIKLINIIDELPVTKLNKQLLCFYFELSRKAFYLSLRQSDWNLVKWYITARDIWRNPIMGPTLCYHPIKMVIRWLWKHFNLKSNCFICYEQSDWSKKVITRIYHIIKYSWHRVTHMWHVMGLRQISHDATYQ